MVCPEVLLDGRLETADERVDVFTALSRLSATERAIVFLRHVSDMSAEQVSVIVGVSPAMVRHLDRQALAALDSKSP